MKRKIIYVPTRRDAAGASSLMVVPWDYVEEFIAEMHKQGILPTMMGDEVPVLDYLEIEETIIFPLQVEE